MVTSIAWCARCGRPLRAGVKEDDPRRIFGPVGECRRCADLPDVEIAGPHPSAEGPAARVRKVSFCVLCKRGFSPKPGASGYRDAICQACND